MMGTKARAFAPLPPVSLEELIPPDHFYRVLERSLDLAFVRNLARNTYADIGRPSLDPVVFFKLRLIVFFEGLRSKRQLMRVVADRLSSFADSVKRGADVRVKHADVLPASPLLPPTNRFGRGSAVGPPRAWRDTSVC